jgi:hypothetical protein
MPKLKLPCGLFKLPSPKELGWSEHNSLGSRSLTPFQEGKTWDDWTEYVKEKHPVKYFLVETLPDFFRPIGWKIGRIWYWLKCHVHPGYRFHLVDLRGVDPLSCYTHGYNDPSAVMFLAAWKALRDYIEKEEPVDPATWATPEEMLREGLIDQKVKCFDEPHALYKYWMEERVAEKAEEERLYALCKKDKKDALAIANEDAYDKASEAWLAYHRACEAREQEMFLKLCALREYLWT